jgi:hypothetical protein
VSIWLDENMYACFLVAADARRTYGGM